MPIEIAEELLDSQTFTGRGERELVELTKAWFHQMEARGYSEGVNFNRMANLLKDGNTSWGAVALVARATVAYRPDKVDVWLAKVADVLKSEPLPRPDLCCGLFLAVFETGIWIDHVWKFVDHRQLFHKWWRLLLEIIDNPAFERLMVGEDGKLDYPDKAFPGRLSEAIKGFIRPRLEGKDKALVRGYQVKQLGAELWNRGDDVEHRSYAPFVEVILNELAFAAFGMWIPSCKMAGLHIVDEYFHTRTGGFARLRQRELNDRLLGPHYFKPGRGRIIVGFRLFEKIWKGQPTPSGWDNVESRTVIFETASFDDVCDEERKRREATGSKPISYEIEPIQILAPSSLVVKKLPELTDEELAAEGLTRCPDCGSVITAAVS
ncbi:MAG: hypothetical protein WC451_00270 [Patescibacteria group bacterium]